jgi:tetratricopeptide (TPR) repeat protein
MPISKNLVLVFALALALRLLYIFEIADNPFFTSPVVDAQTYTEQARLIAAGNWLDYEPGPFWQPPLYPWFAATIYWLAGEHFFLAMRFVQALFGAFSCALLYLIGQRLFDRRVAFGAAGALALYGPAIYFDAEILPASAAVLLFLTVVLVVLNSAAKEHPLAWIVPGLLLGLTALNVATVLITLPFLAAWIYFVARPGGRQRAGLKLLSLGAGLFLVIAPVSWRNYIVGNEFVLISWNAGVNFYLGNNPNYPATVQIRPGQEWLDLMDQAHIAGYDSGAESSAFFFKQSWNYIHTQPLHYARLVATKFAVFWSGDEIARNQNIYYFRNYSHLLAIVLWKYVLAFPFGLVGPLAIVGLFLAARTGDRSVRLLIGLTLSYAAGVVLFFVTARYRLPLIPFLLLFAAFAVSQLASAVRHRHRHRTKLLWGAVVLLLTVWTNWTVSAMEMSGDAEHYYNLGHAYIEKKRLAAGIEALKKAADMAPEDAEILFSLGTAYAFAADYRAAAAVLKPAAQLYPNRMDIRLNLGNAYFTGELYHRAATEYLAVLKNHPDDVIPRRGAARALARSGQTAAAIAHYERLQSLQPSDLESYLALGYFYNQNGRSDEALIQFSGALELAPQNLTALLEISQLYLARNATDRALALLQQAAHHYPDNAQVHIRLGQFFAARHRWGKAIAAYRKALQLTPDNATLRQRLVDLAQQTVDGERDQ